MSFVYICYLWSIYKLCKRDQRKVIPLVLLLLCVIVPIGIGPEEGVHKCRPTSAVYICHYTEIYQLQRDINYWKDSHYLSNSYSINFVLCTSFMVMFVSGH